MSQLEELDRGTAVPDCPYVGLATTRRSTPTSSSDVTPSASGSSATSGRRASPSCTRRAASGRARSFGRRGAAPSRARREVVARQRAVCAGGVQLVGWRPDRIADRRHRRRDRSLRERPSRVPRGTLAEAVAAAAAATDATMLVILDQFEELFLYSRRATTIASPRSSHAASTIRPARQLPDRHSGGRVRARRRPLQGPRRERLRELPPSRLPRPRSGNRGDRQTDRAVQRAETRRTRGLDRGGSRRRRARPGAARTSGDRGVGGGRRRSRRSRRTR